MKNLVFKYKGHEKCYVPEFNYIINNFSLKDDV